MSSREAVVVQVDGTQVSLRSVDTCQGCGQAGGCGLRSEPDGRLWQLAMTGKLTAGQRVRIEAPPGLVLRAALAAYGLPLLGALLGAGLGARFGEAVALVGLILGLVLGVRVFKACSQRWQRQGLISPRLIPISVADAPAASAGPVRPSFSSEEDVNR